MRSCICHEWGPPSSLRIVDGVAPLCPGAGEVSVAVHACGINFPDLLMIQGKYQVRPTLPFAPGGEVAGVISGVGEGVTRFSVGERVVAFTGIGGCTTDLTISERKVSPLPQGMDFNTGSAFFLAYGTADYALRVRAKLCPGELVLVLGASGGVGLAATQLAKATGATVIAAASTWEKLRVCKEAGADMLLAYDSDGGSDGGSEVEGGLGGQLKRLVRKAGKSGVDVVVDVVGGGYCEPALRSMARGGRYLVIGFASGVIPKVPLNLVLLKETSIVGVFWGSWFERDSDGSSEQVTRLVHMYQEGILRPLVSRVYTLDQTALALEDMGNRKVVGKVVVAPRDGGGVAEGGVKLMCGRAGSGAVVRVQEAEAGTWVQRQAGQGGGGWGEDKQGEHLSLQSNL
ncbi:unnamed protein product [Discosporangium mesarthrocarpum]